MVTASLQRIRTVGERTLVGSQICLALSDFLRKFFRTLSRMRKCLLGEEREFEEIGELHDANATKRRVSGIYNTKNRYILLEIGKLLLRFDLLFSAIDLSKIYR